MGKVDYKGGDMDFIAGDMLISTKNGRSNLEVQGKIGRIYVLIDLHYDSCFLYTKEQLISRGYKLKIKETLVELTMEDISAGKGKGIPSHLLRIKE